MLPPRSRGWPRPAPQPPISSVRSCASSRPPGTAARPGSRSPPHSGSRPGPARKSATPTWHAAGRVHRQRTSSSRRRRQAEHSRHQRRTPRARTTPHPARPPGRVRPGTDPAQGRQAAARKPGAGTRHLPDPKITPGIIGNGRYDIVKAPDHAETRAWHVLVGGQRAGLVRPTWRGERSRHGWEAVDNAGTAVLATGTGRVTAAGNALTRDAAAVSLLRTLLRNQEGEPVKRRQPCPA
jgi:hypothetical protein